MIAKQILKCKKKVEYHKGICKIGRTKKSVSRIESNMETINELMFDPGKAQTDPELFEIIVLRSKLPHFNFLKGRTRIRAIGTGKIQKARHMIKKRM